LDEEVRNLIRGFSDYFQVANLIDKAHGRFATTRLNRINPMLL